jgi:signal transduction histidine kinase
LYCTSSPGEGTEFVIQIPLQQSSAWIPVLKY